MYPNSYKGLKKIYTAEMIQLIASVAIAVFGVMAVSYSEAEMSGMMVVTVLLAFVAGIGIIVAYFMTFLGLRNASGDDPSFKSGFQIALAALIISTAGSILTTANPEGLLGRFLQTLASVFSIMVTFYIIQGIINISGKIGNRDMVENGKNVFRIYACAMLGALVLNMCINFISGTAGAILGLAVLAAQIVGYIAYLKYLSKAVKMLSR